MAPVTNQFGLLWSGHITAITESMTHLTHSIKSYKTYKIWHAKSVLESTIFEYPAMSKSPYYNVRAKCNFEGVYSTARVVAVRAAYMRQKGEGASARAGPSARNTRYLLHGGVIIYAQERITSFRNLFVLRFMYIFYVAYKRSRTVFLINIFSQADLKKCP